VTKFVENLEPSVTMRPEGCFDDSDSDYYAAVLVGHISQSVGSRRYKL